MTRDISEQINMPLNGMLSNHRRIMRNRKLPLVFWVQKKPHKTFLPKTRSSLLHKLAAQLQTWMILRIFFLLNQMRSGNNACVVDSHIIDLVVLLGRVSVLKPETICIHLCMGKNVTLFQGSLKP